MWGLLSEPTYSGRHKHTRWCLCWIFCCSRHGREEGEHRRKRKEVGEARDIDRERDIEKGQDRRKMHGRVAWAGQKERDEDQVWGKQRISDKKGAAQWGWRPISLRLRLSVEAWAIQSSNPAFLLAYWLMVNWLSSPLCLFWGLSLFVHQVDTDIALWELDDKMTVNTLPKFMYAFVCIWWGVTQTPLHLIPLLIHLWLTCSAAAMPLSSQV